MNDQTRTDVDHGPSPISYADVHRMAAGDVKAVVCNALSVHSLGMASIGASLVRQLLVTQEIALADHEREKHNAEVQAGEHDEPGSEG